MSRPERQRRAILAWLVLALAGVMVQAVALGYDSQVHQRLTFYAAKELNRCLEGSGLAPLTPLQVRVIATSNMGLANTNPLVRFFRWSYFDISNRDDRQLLWLINTRFISHFEEVAEQVDATHDTTERYRELGRVVSYIQLVSSPGRAVPVYSARFWRASFADRFDAYPVSEQALEEALGGDCSFLGDPPESYRSVLFEVASGTLDAVRSPIGGLPTTWESFWELGQEPGDFGEYGVAGNSFGRRVEFPCSREGEEVCMLLEDDPLYAQFALARQLAAVHGTARAMYLHQIRHAGPHTRGSVADYR